MPRPPGASSLQHMLLEVGSLYKVGRNGGLTGRVEPLPAGTAVLFCQHQSSRLRCGAIFMLAARSLVTELRVTAGSHWSKQVVYHHLPGGPQLMVLSLGFAVQGVLGAATGAGIIIGSYFAFYSNTKKVLRERTTLPEGEHQVAALCVSMPRAARTRHQRIPKVVYTQYSLRR